MFGTRKQLRAVLESLNAALKLADDTTESCKQATDLLDKANRVADDWERLHKDATQCKPAAVDPVPELTLPHCRWDQLGAPVLPPGAGVGTCCW
jgi:uncharacterized protein YoxC